MKKITLYFIFFLSYSTLGMTQNIQVNTLFESINASGGMSIDQEGNIYVSDFGPALGQSVNDSKVYKIDKDDFSFSVFAEGFSGASGACFDSNGNFYQSNPHGNKISKVNTDGTVALDWATEGFNTPIGIITDSEDNLYVCNCGGNNIAKITPEGEVSEFATSDLFNCPNGLTIDENNNLYACNYVEGKVLKITPEAEVSEITQLPVLTGGPNPIGCGHLTYSLGHLFVTTIGTGQVFKVGLDGESELIAGAAFGFSNEDGAGLNATFSKPNGIIASVTGDTLFINGTHHTWPGNPTGLHPSNVRMITGVCSLEDVLCESEPSGSMFSQITTGEIVTELRLSMGSSWADFNQDGWMDIFICSGINNNRLYQNNGDGTFERMNNIVSNDGGNTGAAVWGDYNGDGYLDLYVSNNPPAADGPQANFLYQNNGPPNYGFTKITNLPPAIDANHTWSSSWVDYDNDGDLDLHVPENRHLGLDYFYENTGSGFQATTPAFVTDVVESTGVVSWMDYDNDGDQDLFMIKSGRSHPNGVENNRIFHNNLTETGTLEFQRVFTAEMVNHLDLDFQASWGDYDNDGDMDVYLGNFDGPNYLYRNEGDSIFTRITSGRPVTDNRATLGATWGDFDNDGWLDLFVTNTLGQRPILYKNEGNGVFSVPTANSVGPPTLNASNSQSCSNADFNNDGYLDIFVANSALNAMQLQPDYLYQNNGGNNNYFILQCKGTTSNTSAIGTKVRVKATINGQEMWQMRVISGSPTGDRAQNSLRVHFGLGDATIIDSLVIEWPLGLTEVYTSAEVNQICTATENGGTSCIAMSNTTVLPDFIQRFDIHPNPVIGEIFFVEYELDDISAIEWNIYKMNGQLLKKWKTNNTGHLEVNLGDVKKGMYLLEMRTQKGIMSRKIIFI